MAETFGCSESWVRRLARRARESGSLAPRSTARTDDRRAYDDSDEAKIRALIEERPDVVAKRAARFARLAGRRVADLLSDALVSDGRGNRRL